MLQLLQNNPRATSIVRDWFTKQMIESLKTNDVPEEFKEAVRQLGVSDERLSTLIETNPRALFDVFDDNDLIINILHKTDGFIWSIGENKNPTVYSSRRDAEKVAVETAYKFLDAQLEQLTDQS